MLVPDTKVIPYLLLGAARLDKNGKITNLMRNFVQQDGDSGYHANSRPNQEGCTNGKTVREIVCKISSKIQVARHLNICRNRQW